jgi:hypothetical protein
VATDPADGKEAVVIAGTGVLRGAVARDAIPVAPRARTLSDERRTRLAYHEAGHAVARYVLCGGSSLRLVSIEATDRWAGVCLHVPQRLNATPKNLECPLPLMPARLRRILETDVVATLAGQISEDFVEPQSRRGSTPAEKRAKATVDLLTGRERRALDAASTRTDEGLTDTELAFRGAWLLAGSRLAAAQLALLRAVALELVASPRFLRLLAALVPELLAYGTIGGRRTAAILRAADTTGTGIA